MHRRAAPFAPRATGVAERDSTKWKAYAASRKPWRRPICSMET